MNLDRDVSTSLTPTDVATLMGQERIQEMPHYMRMIGTYGNREANWAIQHCDLLLVLGARLDIRQTAADIDDFARNAKVIQVDIDDSQINNRIKADYSIHAAAESFCSMFPLSSEAFPTLEPAWIGELETIRNLAARDEYSDWGISPTVLFNEMNKAFDGLNVHYVCDVGNHQMWGVKRSGWATGRLSIIAGD
jgi:acetolactate synthase I/II/III large subunit